ncbi:MAG: hypothetical protein IJ226_04210, partial [Clostridia bacterium]|nr:hypothetical protein [Clostridia bacterium]
DNAVPGTYELYFKGFLSLKDLYVNDGGTMVELNSKVSAPTINAYACAYKDADGNFVPATSYSVTDDTIKKESKLKRTDAPTREVYFKVHDGESKPLLQSFAYLSIAELQDMDDFVDNITIGDVIEVKNGDPAILKTLQNKKLSELGDATKNLKINEVVDIVFGEYEQDNEGAYIYSESPDGYVAYNEKLHSGMQRYSRSRENETDPFIYTENDEGAYVKNGYFTKYDSTVHTDPNIKRYNKVSVEKESSLIMQALALRECTLDDLSTITNNLYIYEIIDMKADDTSLVMRSLAKHHKTLGNMGSAVDTLTIDEVIEITDSSSLILRSLKARGCKINEMGSVVDDLTIDEVIEITDSSSRLLRSLKKKGAKITTLGTTIDTLTLEEIIDIYEYHQVETSDSLSDNKFLVWQHGTDTQVGYVKYDETRHADEPVRYNYDGTDYVEVLDGKYVYTDTPTTFVKDSSGKYIKSPIAFEPVNRSLATIEAAYKYTWVKGNLDPSTPADVDTFTALAESGNIYYFDDSDYLNNVTLCTYLFSQGATDSSKLDNLYYRENSALGTGNSYYQFSEPNLFVNVLGVFIPYEATNPAHYDMTVYALQTSPYVAGDESDYKYYVRYDEYKDVAVSNDGTNYTYDLGGTKLGAANKYSRQYCESVYLKCDDLTLYPIDQYFVFIDGKYVKYDAEKHEGMDTFIIVQAFLADESQVEALDTNDYTRVHVIHEKSAPVLRMMSEHNINDMSSVVGDAVIDDLMDISPDNMFGTDKIKNSKINDLGSAMSGLMNEMTINKLLDWANITTIDPKVKSAIGDATLTSFFNSLTYQNGSITVNMLKLYGLE